MDLKYCEVSRANVWQFDCEGILAANTLVGAHIVGEDMLLEIEARANVGSGQQGILRISKS
jgi:hypothetical protein